MRSRPGMPQDENEDPEDLLEREQLEQSNRRLKKIAIRSGWLSFLAYCVGLLVFCFLDAVDLDRYRWENELNFTVMVAIAVSSILLASLSALIDLGLVLLLYIRGVKGLGKPLALGILGGLVPSVIMAITALFSIA